MNAVLDDLYLRWLYSRISPTTVKNPARTYWSFAKQLYRKEFVWFIPNDDNRLYDGLALRDQFLADCDIDNPNEEWMSLGCSMLEMLVALSRRFAFMGGGEPEDRFWLLVNNLGIEECSDKLYKNDPDTEFAIDNMLDAVIWRTYDYDGAGGLFPLMYPPMDQRRVELWYQMSSYILEKEGV